MTRRWRVTRARDESARHVNVGMSIGLQRRSTPPARVPDSRPTPSAISIGRSRKYVNGVAFCTTVVTPAYVSLADVVTMRGGRARYSRWKLAIPAQAKNHGPKRAFSRGLRSTRLVTLASRPTPEENVKRRPLTTPTSTRRGRQSSAMRRTCSVASTRSAGMPRILLNTFADPPGRQVSAVSEPTSPFAASLTVPSPPNATTTSYPSRAASRASSVAWPWASVSTASTS